MLEEFHGMFNGTVVTAYKLLYGWGTLNTNVWLPSLSELVGTTGTEHPDSGVYVSAMQGLNTTTWYCVDAKGGTQFAYFKQYNVSGGGEKIWNACKQEQSWLRTSDAGQSQHVWAVTSNATISWAQLVTASHAVHPAMDFVVRNVCKKR